ncbi:MAG: alpha/beta hydrolase fold domain-containing protein [Verrucomicrobia bacterium]|jgi:acetyl esterase/lipase|nr:alpha/beta hydrolase fold domain-containing protein [Verrucomicrobiota bacterium]
MKNKIVAVITFICTFAAGTLTAAEFEPYLRLPYKTIGETELALYVFNPEGHRASDERPVIVFFFGGGWKGGSPSQFYPHSAYLASRGMVAIAAEYRVAKRHGTTPKECVKDGKSAIRWIRENADKLGIDPDKVLAGGGSAGGHVAAATATTDGFEEAGEDLFISSRPAALVLFNPVFDNGPGGYGHDRVADYWEAFSPLHNISETTPPTIVFLGTEDRHVPVATAKAYQRPMVENGNHCDLHLYDGQPHGFFNLKNRENFTKTVAAMDAFLVSLGYLQSGVEQWLETVVDEAEPES